MRLRFFTLLICSAIAFSSCRKDKFEQTIKQYDQSQIESYIAAHGITGMVRDTAGGDTSGIYYQILAPGTGVRLQYSDKISMVFSLRSFDGKYAAVDTIANHFQDYVGHIQTDKLPLGLQTAIYNDLKNSGTRMRVLIPSHLAYGAGGYGSGSTQNANTRIGGNQCLDYYVNVVNSSSDGVVNKNDSTAVSRQATYDGYVIRSYKADSNFTGYTPTASGLYYKILTTGTGTDPITTSSSITTTYTGQLLNATIFDGSHNGANYATLSINDLVPGVQEGLINYAKVGTKISLLIPSKLAYGTLANGIIPVNSCLRFTFVILTVSP